ncbi:MAG: hypothetical protein JRJ39_00465 [Deltaproteobacteria bacterium]|nr:hypothetical protein [Deltaproteobacteria bacterium]MBW1845582.1 hypothetical protein [Deltaproteobacteria bacterium]MBW2032010.1 hypothetical protein [Deltaproteobacteria bacterium]MBW2180971.1 hypothetical protein [Deltaproteobacteria bacterium]
MTPKANNPTETNEFTLTFTGEQLRTLSDMTNLIIEDRLIWWNCLEADQQKDLVEARNLMQKQLDFPDLKF